MTSAPFIELCCRERRLGSNLGEKSGLVPVPTLVWNSVLGSVLRANCRLSFHYSVWKDSIARSPPIPASGDSISITHHMASDLAESDSIHA